MEKPESRLIFETKAGIFCFKYALGKHAASVDSQTLTSRRCEHDLGITRDTATPDFSLLMQPGLPARQGQGRTTSYVLAGKI
jgi:predicted HTH transcriptional regulator